MTANARRRHDWRSAADLRRIFTHPAFVLGVLDYCAGRPLDHDDILRRLPSVASPVEKMQIRYEEGRLISAAYGLRVKSWSNPRRFPRQIRALFDHMIAEREEDT